MLSFSVSDLTDGLNKLRNIALKKGKSPGDYLYIHEYDGNGFVDFSAMYSIISQSYVSTTYLKIGIPCEPGSCQVSAFTVHASSLFRLLSRIEENTLVTLDADSLDGVRLILPNSPSSAHTLPSMSVDAYPMFDVSDARAICSVDVSELRRAMRDVNFFNDAQHESIRVYLRGPKGEEGEEGKLDFVVETGVSIAKTEMCVKIISPDLPLMLLPPFVVKEMIRIFASKVTLSHHLYGILFCDGRHQLFSRSKKSSFVPVPYARKSLIDEQSAFFLVSRVHLDTILRRIVKKIDFEYLSASRHISDWHIDIARKTVRIHNDIREESDYELDAIFSPPPVGVPASAPSFSLYSVGLGQIIAHLTSKNILFHYRMNTELITASDIFLCPFEEESLSGLERDKLPHPKFFLASHSR